MGAGSDSDGRQEVVHKSHKKKKKEKKNKVKKSKKERKESHVTEAERAKSGTNDDAAEGEVTPTKAKLKLRLKLSKKPDYSSGSELEDSPRATPTKEESSSRGKRRLEQDDDNDGNNWARDDDAGEQHDWDQYDNDDMGAPDSPTVDVNQMTKRQRVAFLARFGSSARGSLQEFDEAVGAGEDDEDSLASRKEQREEKKHENARKRKLLLDLQQEEIKKQTIDKLLNKQTSSRLRKEEEQAESRSIRRSDNDRKIEGPYIRYVSKREGEFVSFPKDYQIVA